MAVEYSQNPLVTSMDHWGENTYRIAGSVFRGIFANGWHLCISRIKFSRIAIISATPPEQAQAGAARACNIREIRENFLPRNKPYGNYATLAIFLPGSIIH